MKLRVEFMFGMFALIVSGCLRQAAVKAFSVTASVSRAQSLSLGVLGTSTLVNPCSTRLWVYYSDHREADTMEQLIGGERYDMAQLPDSMMETTLFVGNLCEFVKDEDLSILFGSVSTVKTVPACVVRKPDMTSLQYGFVSFLSVKEKEAALIRFHNYEFRGRPLKVQEIRDHPIRGRVRLPERMIAYVSGAVKSVPGKGNNNNSNSMNSLRRISSDDVERLSRGQPAKKKGYGSRGVPHRLNDHEREELARARRKGYVSLQGSGNRRARRGSPLANIFRQWCDSRAKPQIMLYKTLGSESKQPLDRVVVDLSPLRLYGTNTPMSVIESTIHQYIEDIEEAAADAGMVRCGSSTNDGEEEPEECNMEMEQPSWLDKDEEAQDGDDDDDEDEKEVQVLFSIDSATQEAWATKPIWQLPMLETGEFWGERSQAKALAKALAILWSVPEEAAKSGEVSSSTFGPQSRKAAGAKGGDKSKMRGLSDHRKRGGGHRQSFY